MHRSAISSKNRKIGAIVMRRMPIARMSAHAPDMRRRLSISAIEGRRSFFAGAKCTMQVKVYVPKIIEIPSEFLPALAKRAADSLGEKANEVSATRGHLVRQAVQDGLLREMDELIGQDGTVDLVCDPGMEIPLELENRTLTLSELLEALQYKRSWSEMKGKSEAA
jgi:hypothetical protein